MLEDETIQEELLGVKSYDTTILPKFVRYLPAEEE
jgi:hypothetical protein